MSDVFSDLPPLETLFDHAPCGLLLTDSNGIIVRLNATICRWLDYEADALLGKICIQDLLTIGGKVFFQTHCVPLLAMQGSVAEVQVDMRRRNGVRIPMLLNIVRRTHGGVTFEEFALFVATDRKSYERELLAARRNAEASLEAQLGAEEKLHQLNDQLSAADRKKDEFLATLAHELRNPLAPMTSALDMLRLTLPREASRDKMLQMLDRQVSQMTHLVDDLMEISRITQGRMELRRKPLSLASVIEAAAADVQTMMESARHTLLVSLPPDDVIVNGDRTRLSQVVVNLLTNAAKYTPGGGNIALAVELEAGEALISVRDNGIGIPVESLSTVFEMFSQLQPALNRSKGGLGIGLALVKGLVHLHGGTIEARSAGLGLGTEFLVRLPVILQAVAPAAKSDGPRAGSLRVLIVDDNVDAADMLAEVLGYFGYETRTAYNGASALEIVAGFLPQVAVLDIGLPDMTGYELARCMRQQDRGQAMTLIAATGWGQAADKQLAHDAGFDRHLTKPLDIDELGAILASIPHAAGATDQ